VPKRIINKPNIDLEVKKGIAWAVHAFTTCGIIAGFLALVAVLKGDAVEAFMWLGVALFVDGVDGSLARRARVREYTPNFDGASLDFVIDYFTYVAVPAVMVYWFNMVPLDWIFAGSTWSLVAAATIMAVSCYTFANVGMKSEDYYFVGFPAIWNVVVLYFYVLDTGWLVNAITIAALSILTFIPIKFVHPLRVAHWRNVTIPMTVLWAAMAISLVISKNKATPDAFYEIELWVWIAASVYFASISLWRTFVQGDPEHGHDADDHAA
jgi:phosphatidylcholine synthase